jgi:hypothetical protein
VEYQLIVSPALAIADSDTVPVLHRDPFVPVGADGNAFIVAITLAREVEVQPEATLRVCA